MILRNQILIEIESQRQLRVLDEDRAEDVIWLFDIRDSKALPIAFPSSLVKSPQSFTEIETPDFTAKLKVSSAAKAHREKIYAIIEPLVKSTPDIFNEAKRHALVLVRAQETGVTRQSIYTYLRTWWRNGQNIQGLTPRYYLCGHGRGTKGRGRTPKFQNGIFQVTEEDRKNFEVILSEVYLKSDLQTLTTTYQALREKHYSYVDAENRLVLLSSGECPSLRQFRYYVRKHLPKELGIRQRKGDSVYELKYRPVLGSQRLATYTAGEIFEIDSTVGDIFLVHHHDRSKLIGKPCIYLIVDRKTSLIVGWYAGLEDSSWMAAQLAILSITEDKKLICSRHNVAYDQADWPAHGVMPNSFVADRGSEMLSKNSTQIVENLGITVANLPARRADWKPFVELSFRLIQRYSLKGVVPGYTPPEDFGKRQIYDHSQDAALTLNEFQKILLEAIIRHNQTPIADYPLEPAYVLQGVQPTPLNLWRVEQETRAGLLEQFTERQVRFALLPQGQASITREGICFGGCYYSAQQAIRQGWFIAAGQGSFKRTISFDLRSVDTLYIHDENSPDGYFLATLLEKSAHFAGLSYREVEALNYEKKQLNADGAQMTAQRTAYYHANIQSTIHHAQAQTQQATKGKSRRSRKVDTKAAREDARHLERDSSLIAQAKNSGPIPVGANDSPPNDLPSNVTPLHSKPVSLAEALPSKYQDMLNGK